MFAFKANSILISMKGHYSIAEHSKLNTLAKLALIGLVYVYIVKLADTLYHGIFSPSAVAMVVVGLNIMAGLIQLSFFVELYRQFVPKYKQTLMVAAWLSIIGSAVARSGSLAFIPLGM